jgi:hypothetical protein
VLVRLEVRLCRASPCDEEPPRLGPFEHRHRVDVLALHPQPLPTRHEDVGTRAFRQYGRHLGRGLDDVLEVVQHEQKPASVDELGQRPAASEYASRGRADIGGIRKRRERNPPHAVRVGLCRLASRLQGETRLSRSACTREREQAGVLPHEKLPHLREFVLAAEKLGRRDRQVRAIERLERRELAVAELEDPLRRAEILEPVLAEVA